MESTATINSPLGLLVIEIFKSQGQSAILGGGGQNTEILRFEGVVILERQADNEKQSHWCGLCALPYSSLFSRTKAFAFRAY